MMMVVVVMMAWMEGVDGSDKGRLSGDCDVLGDDESLVVLDIL